MDLLKTSALTAISTGVRILSGFIINKVLAMYAGPLGLAIVGQMQNFNSMVMTFAKGGITQGIVKYTAEYNTIEEKQKIFSTSIIISLLSSVLVGIGLFIFRDYFSYVILKGEQYGNVFAVFGCTIILFAFNSVFMAILNGQKEIKGFVIANILSSLFSLLITCLLVIEYSLIGALYALVLSQSVVFFITLFITIKTNWFKLQYFINGIDRSSLKKLGKFSLMAMVSAVVVPVSHLCIRNYIVENLSWDSAGYWQGVWNISKMYLLFITTSLGVYYTPKLSGLKDKKSIRNEIFNGYIKIIPIVIVLALVIFTLKEYVILIAYSSEFIPMNELFLWQLIGDVIKISSYLISTIMIAKAMTFTYIFSEILFSVTYVLLSYYLISKYNLIGVTYAYALNYFLYLSFIVLRFRSLFYVK